MLRFNILKWLYKQAPMNFYNYSEDATTIKSINNVFLGYKFNKKFTSDELEKIWKLIKQHKRFSTILIFILFIVSLYGLIFPNYYFICEQNWYYTALPILLIFFLIYHLITILCTKHFQKMLNLQFGDFEKIKYQSSKDIDIKYYKIFKQELAKAFCLILFILLCFSLGSPFKIALNLIHQGKYSEAINLTTIGSKIFPIATEWYSLRGYARYKMKDYNEAIKDYDKAYKLGPDEYNVMNFDNKIYIKYLIKDYKSALKDFDYEIAHASDSYEKDSFLWDKAQFLYNIKQYKDALKIYNDLIIKAESDRIYLLQNRLYFERAQVYKQLGMNKEANQDIQNAEDLSIEDSFKNPIPKPTILLDDI